MVGPGGASGTWRAIGSSSVSSPASRSWSTETATNAFVIEAIG